jgi:hypothetical protein
MPAWDAYAAAHARATASGATGILRYRVAMRQWQQAFLVSLGELKWQPVNISH